MSWQLLAVACSFSYSLQNVLIKGLSRQKIGSLLMLFMTFAAAVPVLFFVYWFTQPHDYSSNFSIVMIFAIAGNLVAFYGYVRAIELSDVSLVSPLLSLSPFFMLLTSWLIVSETPDFQGLLGILGVVMGTYFLSSSGNQSKTTPIKSLWAKTGTRWALIVSFIWSIQANIDKLAVQASNPFAYAFWFHVVFTVVFTPYFIYKRRRESSSKNSLSIQKFSSRKVVLFGIVPGLLGLGVFQALMSATQMTAIIRTDVTYVIAIKRAGMLLAVLLGGLLYDEPYTGKRFLSALVVLLGLLGIMFR